MVTAGSAAREPDGMAQRRNCVGTNNNWMTTGEAAETLGVDRRTLYRLLNEGRLDCYRVGRVIRLRVDHVTAYLASCRVEPGTLSHLYSDDTD